MDLNSILKGGCPPSSGAPRSTLPFAKTLLLQMSVVTLRSNPVHRYIFVYLSRRIRARLYVTRSSGHTGSLAVALLAGRRSPCKLLAYARRSVRDRSTKGIGRGIAPWGSTKIVVSVRPFVSPLTI